MANRLDERPLVRIVLDTNVLLSALMNRGTPPNVLYEMWRDRKFDLFPVNCNSMSFVQFHGVMNCALASPIRKSEHLSI